MSRLRPHLTYANVMATVAVFVALGGGAYAAVQLPKNSVKAKQIAKNAVRSPEVKNRSLRRIDFRRGSLPAGERGPQGEPGPVGLTPGASRTFGVGTSGKTLTCSISGTQTSCNSQGATTTLPPGTQLQFSIGNGNVAPDDTSVHFAYRAVTP
jgi:hypothetical protein